jgi:hypothetical protein
MRQMDNPPVPSLACPRAWAALLEPMDWRWRYSRAGPRCQTAWRQGSCSPSVHRRDGTDWRARGFTPSLAPLGPAGAGAHGSMQHRSTMNHRTSLSRTTRAALLALALGCGPALHAQDAATPSPAPRALPGVADIDFSLRGREVETPGTPTEGPVRPSATPAPAGPAPAPQASPPPPASGSAGAGGDLARPRAAPAGAPLSAPDPASLPAADTPVPLTPDLDAAPASSQGQAPADAVAAPHPAVEQSPSGFPAWPFGLAALALAVWFALRRRKPANEAIADGEPEPVAEPAHPAAAEPSAMAVPAPVADPVPAAHPALRVRLAAPVEEPAEPEPGRAAPQPVAPAPAAITRYDAFGRPIAGPPLAPKPPPPPPPPPKPRARIVRYDAMGLPILD